MTTIFGAIVAGLMVILALWALVVVLARWQPALATWLYAPIVQRAIVILSVGVVLMVAGRGLSSASGSTSSTMAAMPPLSIEFMPTPPASITESSLYNILVFESTFTRTLISARPMLPPSTLALDLKAFPRPAGDNGRGLHWFPTTSQTKAVVDTFVPELVAMCIKWLTFVQGLEDYELNANDYLVRSLLKLGIMPVMRVEARIGAMDMLRFRRVVEHYRALGVRYIQIYNEPNLKDEWHDGKVATPEQFTSLWLEAAEIVITANGFAGLAALSPSGDPSTGSGQAVSDYDYLRATLEALSHTRRYDVLQRTWLAVHNYSGGRPSDFVGDEAGYGRYRRYAAISRVMLGTVLPMIGTEGGPQPADAQTQARWIAEAYQSLRAREPYWFAYSPWLIGNAVGGGKDARWERAAWFKVDRVEPVVEMVKRLS